MHTPTIKTDDTTIRTIGLAVLLLALLIFGLWGARAPIDSAAIAPGVIEVESDRSTVQHLEGGIVKTLHVKEGDLVEKGDLLIDLESTLAGAQLEATRGRYIAELARQTRLLAEQSSQSRVRYPSFEAAGVERSDRRVQNAMAAQNALFQARLATLDGQIKLLDERIEQLAAKATGLQRQRVINQRRIAKYDDELERFGKLVKQGLTALQPLFVLERERDEVKAMVAGLATEIVATELGAGETRLQSLQVTRQFQEKVADELSKLQAQLPQLAEQLNAYTDTVSRMSIRAPTSGKVLALAVTTVGGVVQAGAPLMDLVPQDAALVVEARVSPLDIDRVHAGLSAKVNLPAFKSAITPSVEGTVTKVSADSLEDPVTGARYYEARIVLTEAQVTDLELTPGMPADAMIRTGEHTLVAYLAQPLTDAFSRSFIED